MQRVSAVEIYVWKQQQRAFLRNKDVWLVTEPSTSILNGSDFGAFVVQIK